MDQSNRIFRPSQWRTAAPSLALRMALTACLTSAPVAGLTQEAETAGADQSASTPSNTAPQATSFAAAFDGMIEPLDAQLTNIDPLTPEDAVDLDSFEPPRGARVLRSLGTGVASYYGRRFHGRLTANGERFDMGAMTAAHKTLPFGSMVRVTNPRNGLTVTVRINDRGPFIRGREIDLSRAAAERIDMIARGHEPVVLELVAP